MSISTCLISRCAVWDGEPVTVQCSVQWFPWLE